MPNENIVFRAQGFAWKAHDTQHRMTIAGVRRPFLVHIQEVVDLVWASGGSDEELAAAWLHDSLEDTPTSMAQVEQEFGKEVAEIVHGLTDLDHFKDLPVDVRKKAQAERVRTESDSVKRVKIADQTSNVRFLAMDPPTTMDFDECGKYIQGAKLIADECRSASPLLNQLFDEAYAKAFKRYFPKEKGLV